MYLKYDLPKTMYSRSYLQSSLLNFLFDMRTRHHKKFPVLAEGREKKKNTDIFKNAA